MSRSTNGDTQNASASRDEGGAPESFARKLYSAVAALLAATIARKVMNRLWVKTTGKVPPEKPESPEVHWAEAVGWSALSGTSVAVARLLASRRAAGAWKRVSDDSPTLVRSGTKPLIGSGTKR